MHWRGLLTSIITDFHERGGHKYVKDYELIKINDAKSHLILEVTDLEVTDLEGFGAATSSS